MSQLPTPGLTGRVIRDRFTPDAPALGIRGDLDSPGIVFPLPVSRGATLAAQLAESIGIAGNVIGAIQAVEERERREAEILDAKNQQVHKGLAQKHLGEWLPSLALDLAEGRRRIPEGMSVKDYAAAIVEEELDREGSAPAYREIFRQQATDDVNRILTARAIQIRADARDAILGTLSLRLDDPSLTSDEAAAVWAEAKQNGGDLSDAQLYDKVIRPARDRAVERGDAELFGIMYKGLPAQFQGDRASYQLRAQARRRQIDEDQANATRNDLFRRASEGAALPALLDSLEDARTKNVIPHEEAGQLRQFFIGRAQQRGANDLRRAIFQGTATPEDVEAILQTAVGLPEDNAFHLDPVTAQGIRDFAAERQRVSTAKRQAMFVLSGAPGNLTESQHGTAIVELIGPDNSGMIDEANRIAQPGRLATTLLQARIVPRQIRETLTQAVTSDDPKEVLAASQVIGAIAAGSPRMYARLLDDAGPSLRPVMDAAAEQFSRGLFTDAAKSAAAVEKVRGAREAVQEIPRPSPQLIADFRRQTKVDPTATLDAETDRILERVRDGFPHAKNFGIFGWDWAWGDPSLTNPNLNVRRRVEGWLMQRFGELQNLPREQAIAKATEYAEAQVRNAVDFVRWNGQVRPALIDTGDGYALPPSLRWGEGFEKEAAADLKAAGFDPGDIATLRPLLNPIVAPGQDAEAALGWVYVTNDGDDLRDDQGRLILFRPTDKTRAENDRLRALLDKKEAASAAGQRAFEQAQRMAPVESPLRAPFNNFQGTLGPLSAPR